MAERPLHVHHGIVVVFALHRTPFLTGFVVIGGQRIGPARIGKGKPGAEVRIPGKQIGQCVTPVIAGQQDIDDSLRQRLYIADQTRPSLVQHQYEGFPRRRQFADQFFLVLRQVQIIHVARSFTIGVLADADDNHVCIGRCRDCFADSPHTLHLPILRGGAVFYAWNPGNMIEFTRQGLVNRIVTICKLIATLTLPGVRPAAVETAHGIGIGAGEQDTRRLRER